MQCTVTVKPLNNEHFGVSYFIATKKLPLGDKIAFQSFCRTTDLSFIERLNELCPLFEKRGSTVVAFRMHPHTSSSRSLLFLCCMNS